MCLNSYNIIIDGNINSSYCYITNSCITELTINIINSPSDNGIMDVSDLKFKILDKKHKYKTNLLYLQKTEPIKDLNFTSFRNQRLQEDDTQYKIEKSEQLLELEKQNEFKINKEIQDQQKKLILTDTILKYQSLLNDKNTLVKNLIDLEDDHDFLILGLKIFFKENKKNYICIIKDLLTKEIYKAFCNKIMNDKLDIITENNFILTSINNFIYLIPSDYIFKPILQFKKVKSYYNKVIKAMSAEIKFLNEPEQPEQNEQKKDIKYINDLSQNKILVKDCKTLECLTENTIYYIDGIKRLEQKKKFKYIISFTSDHKNLYKSNMFLENLLDLDEDNNEFNNIYNFCNIEFKTLKNRYNKYNKKKEMDIIIDVKFFNKFKNEIINDLKKQEDEIIKADHITSQERKEIEKINYIEKINNDRMNEADEIEKIKKQIDNNELTEEQQQKIKLKYSSKLEQDYNKLLKFHDNHGFIKQRTNILNLSYLLNSLIHDVNVDDLYYKILTKYDDTFIKKNNTLTNQIKAILQTGKIKQSDTEYYKKRLSDEWGKLNKIYYDDIIYLINNTNIYQIVIILIINTTNTIISELKAKFNYDLLIKKIKNRERQCELFQKLINYLKIQNNKEPIYNFVFLNNFN